MKTKNIEQSFFFEAQPEAVYQLMMDSKKHSAFTESEAIIDPRVNGKFTVFGSYCHGHNVALDPGKKIVQAWHFDEKDWPKDHFSICTFLFEKEENGTRLKFSQTEVPSASSDAIMNGWYEYYWEPMALYLSKNQG